MDLSAKHSIFMNENNQRVCWLYEEVLFLSIASKKIFDQRRSLCEIKVTVNPWEAIDYWKAHPNEFWVD